MVELTEDSNILANKKIYKIIVLGDSGVGKTCFIMQYTDQIFTENHISTIGVDYKTKTLQHDNKIIAFQIWDTAGQDRFRSLTKNYITNSDGILLMYDITNEISFKNMKNWLSQIKDKKSAYKDIQVVVVANKCDLIEKSEVETWKAEELCKKHGFKFCEASAKKNINVAEAFQMLFVDIIVANDMNYDSDNPLETTIRLKSRFHKKKKNKECC